MVQFLTRSLISMQPSLRRRLKNTYTYHLRKINLGDQTVLTRKVQP